MGGPGYSCVEEALNDRLQAFEAAWRKVRESAQARVDREPGAWTQGHQDALVDILAETQAIMRQWRRVVGD